MYTCNAGRNLECRQADLALFTTKRKHAMIGRDATASQQPGVHGRPRYDLVRTDSGEGIEERSNRGAPNLIVIVSVRGPPGGERQLERLRSGRSILAQRPRTPQPVRAQAKYLTVKEGGSSFDGSQHCAPSSRNRRGAERKAAKVTRACRSSVGLTCRCEGVDSDGSAQRWHRWACLPSQACLSAKLGTILAQAEVGQSAST